MMNLETMNYKELSVLAKENGVKYVGVRTTDLRAALEAIYVETPAAPEEVYEGTPNPDLIKYNLGLKIFNGNDAVDLSEDVMKDLLTTTAKEFSVNGVRELSINTISSNAVAIVVSSRKPITDVRRWLVGFSSKLYKKVGDVSKTKKRVFTIESFDQVTA